MAGLDDLKRRLYQKGEKFGGRTSTPDLTRTSQRDQTTWKKDTMPKKSKNNLLVLISVAVGAIALGVAILFISGFPSFLKIQAINIEIVGEEEIKSGENIVWEVRIKNENSVPLHDVVVVFNFPENARPGSGAAQVITGRSDEKTVYRERRSIGTLAEGESVVEKFDAFVFGSRNTKQSVSAVVEYRPDGASATFAKSDVFDFNIERSPLAVSFDMPEEIRIGQDLSFTMNYTSQAEQAIENVYLILKSPRGVVIENFSVPRIQNIPFDVNSDEIVWNIGTLEPAQNGEISVSGKISGVNFDAKSFVGTIGVFNDKAEDFLRFDENAIVTILRSPFLEVAIDMVRLGNKDVVEIAAPGETLSFRVKWKNNLQVPIRDAVLKVKLDGDVLDIKSLSVNDGTFNHSTQSIVWNASQYEKFESIDPDESGVLQFTVKSKSSFPLDTSDERPTITVSAEFKSGTEIQGLEGVDVTGFAEKEVKVASRIEIVSKGFYFDSPIPTFGPLPPRIGQETVYTITWSLTNMTNDVDNVVVRSSLPPYMNFKNVVVPSDIDIEFNETTGVLEWRIGRVPAGTGFVRPALQIAFQVGIVPATDQLGRAPTLVEDTIAEAEDTFTGARLIADDRFVTIALPDDRQLSFGQKSVAP
jgi:hypothetical protein